MVLWRWHDLGIWLNAIVRLFQTFLVTRQKGLSVFFLCLVFLIKIIVNRKSFELSENTLRLSESNISIAAVERIWEIKFVLFENTFCNFLRSWIIEVSIFIWFFLYFFHIFHRMKTDICVPSTFFVDWFYIKQSNIERRYFYHVRLNSYFGWIIFCKIF